MQAQTINPSSGPVGDIEQQVKKVLDMPQYKQQAVFAREAHENIEKQEKLNKILREKIEQQESALTDMHDSIAKSKK